MLIPRLLALICALLASPVWAQTQTSAYPVSESVDLIEWEQEWLFWASDAAPPVWPLTIVPPAQDVLSLHAEVPASPVHKRDLISSARDDPDHLLFLRHDFLGLITEGVWWSGYRAPFSGHSELRWLAQESRWKKDRRSYRRRNGAHPERAQLVYPIGRRPSVLPDSKVKVDKTQVEPGLTNLYFVRSFNVEDPDTFEALQIHARFNKGIRVFINGHLVAKARMNGGLTGHGEFGVELDVPDFISMDIGPKDWWETQWMGIPSDVLQPGENIISAVVHKAETGGNPAMYFDLRLRGWTDFGWVKLPYLHQVHKTGVTISWETTASSRGIVEIRDRRGEPVKVITDSFLGIHHEVVVDGLQPDREYRYVVHVSPEAGSGLEPLVTESKSFYTAPRDNQNFSFLFYGDSRYGDKIHRSLAELMLQDMEEHDSRVVMHAGDIVSYGYDWDRWQDKFFAPSWPLISQVPIYPSVGNHEQNQKLYYDYFDLPGNESWYHFRYGIVDFFALNTNVNYRIGSEQNKWFEEALEASTAPWKVVFFHHPPYACAPSRKPGSTRVQEHLVPMMEAHGVDLVLLGHDHLYGRSRDMNGVTYVISGGGGSPLYKVQPDSIMEVCDQRYNYVRFDVSEDAIRWTAIDLEGEIIEEYAIPQQAIKPSP